MPSIPQYSPQVEAGGAIRANPSAASFGFGGLDDVAGGLQEVSAVLHQSAVKDDLTSITDESALDQAFIAGKLKTSPRRTAPTR